MSKSLVAFPYYGGKNSHLKFLLPRLPVDRPHYVEVFGGSAAVLLNRQAAGTETYNDLNGVMVNFFRVLRQHPQELITALRLTPYAREEFWDCLKLSADCGPIELARRFYVLIRQGRNAKWDRLPERTSWRYTWDGRNRTSRTWAAGVDHLVAVAERLRQVQIECDDALTIIRRYSGPHTLFYVDPPYSDATRDKDGAGYGIPFTLAHHVALSQLLHSTPAQVAVSGYGGLYSRLYGDWHQHVAPEVKSGAAPNGKLKREILWTNYEVPQGGFCKVELDAEEEENEANLHVA